MKNFVLKALYGVAGSAGTFWLGASTGALPPDPSVPYSLQTLAVGILTGLFAAAKRWIMGRFEDV